MYAASSAFRDEDEEIDTSGDTFAGTGCSVDEERLSLSETVGFGGGFLAGAIIDG